MATINFETYSVTRMSFWDVSFTSSSSGTSTPQPQLPGQPSQSLNEEVTEVIGQLGRFWGGFRKQVRHSIVFSQRNTECTCMSLLPQRVRVLSKLRARTWVTMSRRHRGASTTKSRPPPLLPPLLRTLTRMHNRPLPHHPVI